MILLQIPRDVVYMSNRLTTIIRYIIILAMVVLAGCTSSPESNQTPPPVQSSDQILYYGGTIITMDETKAEVEALLIDGDKIAAVGPLAEVQAFADPGAQQVNLAGRFMVPGFIDSHSHRLSQRFKWGFETVEEAVAAALAEGWTGIDEMALAQDEFEALVEADRRGEVMLRVNAYLAVNPFAGGDVDEWYDNYRPHQMISPNIRVAGLKIFIDFDSGRVLLWEPDDLADFVAHRHAEGWQISMKAIGVQSHELALQAIEYALAGDSNENYRHRLEHSLAVTDEQLDLLAQLGIVVAIQPGFPGVIWYEEDIQRLTDEQGMELMFRWPEYVSKGVKAAASPYNPDPRYPEFVEVSHVSPLGVMYRSTTQIGFEDSQPEPWMLDRALNVDQLLPMLTLAGAYATMTDDVRGSLEIGKLADLVVLDINPSFVPADDLLNISIEMTMIGGVARFLRPGSEDLYPLRTSD